MFGYDQGVLSSLLTLDSFVETFPETGGEFNAMQSFMVAVCRWDAGSRLPRSNWLHGGCAIQHLDR